MVWTHPGIRPVKKKKKKYLEIVQAFLNATNHAPSHPLLFICGCYLLVVNNNNINNM